MPQKLVAEIAFQDQFNEIHTWNYVTHKLFIIENSTEEDWFAFSQHFANRLYFKGSSGIGEGYESGVDWKVFQAIYSLAVKALAYMQEKLIKEK